MYIGKKELSKIIVIIVIVITAFVILFFVAKKEEKYTGSIVGTFVDKSETDTRTIVLRQNGTCNITYTSFPLMIINCTYVRQDDEVIMSYYCLNTKKDVEVSYDILPDGNLSVLGLSTYYRQ